MSVSDPRRSISREQRDPAPDGAGTSVWTPPVSPERVAGILAQHWTSLRGDSDRPDARQTDIQYIIRRSIPGAMSIGMGPTISIDWEADSGEKVTLPVGLGITKTARWGKTPVKLRAEVHYSVVRPDAVGTEWNFRLQIAPVIPSPFTR